MNSTERRYHSALGLISGVVPILVAASFHFILLAFGSIHTLNGQSLDQRFAKAKAHLQQRFDSVVLSALDVEQSNLALAYCKNDKNRILRQWQWNSDGSIRQDVVYDTAYCSEGFIVSTHGDVFPYCWITQKLESSDTKRHFIVAGKGDSYQSCSWGSGFEIPCDTTLLSVYDGIEWGDPRREYLRHGDDTRLSYLFDVDSGRLIDSGGIRLLYDQYLRIIRDNRVTFFDINKGYMFNWNDPITNSLVELWKHQSTVRLIECNRNDQWRILRLDKSRINDLVFSPVWTADRSYDNDQRRRNVSVVRGDNKYDYFVTSVDIETCDIDVKHILNVKSYQWWYCPATRSSCIETIQLTPVENRHPSRIVSRALVMLEIREEGTQSVVYRKRHWIELNLGPREVGASQEIKLDNQIWVQGDIKCSVECLEVQ